MGESRDANDPRDQLRAMNKEARAEFEGAEMTDTGGQEHASREDREGRKEHPGAQRAPEGGDAAPDASRKAGGSGDEG